MLDEKSEVQLGVSPLNYPCRWDLFTCAGQDHPGTRICFRNPLLTSMVITSTNGFNGTWW